MAFFIIFLFSTSQAFAQDLKTPTPSGTPTRDFQFIYFNLSPEKLWEKAYAELLKSQGQLSKPSPADLSFSANTDLNLAESLFELAYSLYGKNDVKGSVVSLKNEARYSYGENIKNHHLAALTLFHGEADVKFFIKMDQTFKNPNLPPLMPGYDYKAYQLIAEAEQAWSRRDFNLMRNKIFEALWVVYPVTSITPFAQP
ncbi:MAG TPA: hypothetical protein VIJ93_08390 [bacterium]